MHNLTDSELREWQNITDKTNSVKSSVSKPYLIDLLQKLPFLSLIDTVGVVENTIDNPSKYMEMQVCDILKYLGQGSAWYQIPSDELKHELIRIAELEKEAKLLRKNLQSMK
jgi:hypothetical protein